MKRKNQTLRTATLGWPSGNEMLLMQLIYDIGKPVSLIGFYEAFKEKNSVKVPLTTFSGWVKELEKDGFLAGMGKTKAAGEDRISTKYHPTLSKEEFLVNLQLCLIQMYSSEELGQKLPRQHLAKAEMANTEMVNKGAAGSMRFSEPPLDDRSWGMGF